MPVEQIRIGTYVFQLDSFYVDEKSLTATTTRVGPLWLTMRVVALNLCLQDGVRVPLRITFPSIASIDCVTPAGSRACDITVLLSNPPILASTSLSFPGKTPAAKFQMEEKFVDRFKEAMEFRIQV
jgi:hypothetical protein